MSRQTDGRLRRSERTRAAIVEAHETLLRSGTLRPTAQQIAGVAGVSVRTLWSNFGDMDSLLQATVDRWFESDDDLRIEIDPELPLEERIALFCAERERRLVNIAPAARSAALFEPDSEILQRSRARHVGRVVEDVRRVFAQEIDAADDPDRLADALAAVVSWNAWSLMTDDLGRSPDQTRTSMALTLSALLRR